MKKAFLLISAILFCCMACKNEKPTNQEKPKVDQATDKPTTDPIPFRENSAKLTTNIDNLRLRSTAGEDGEEIARLPKGTDVYDLGEISDFTTKIKLRGIQFNEPWVKVRTDKGVTGWLYAGGLEFDMENTNQLSETLLEKRLQNMFGRDISRWIKIYRTRYKSAKTSAQFAKVYGKGLGIRDTMVALMENNIGTIDYEKIADLNWLEQTMPGYIVQLAAEGTVYYLFNDYAVFNEKAMQTEGNEDDLMADLLLTAFAMDSVEHFFPSWFMQTWDYGGSSLLGKGTHFKLLQKMEAVSKTNLFQRETNDLRDRLIKDITGPNVEYWQPQNEILDELNQILDQGFQHLTKEDVIALEKRKKEFENPETHKIKVNQRTGQ